MITIPNGIDLVDMGALAGPAEGQLLRQRHGIAADDTVLLSVGRLEHNKGFDLLAQALGRAARPGGPMAGLGWRWVLAGAGPHPAATTRRGGGPRGPSSNSHDAAGRTY